MTPQQALVELHNQHQSLRALMDRCDQLADELDDRGNSSVLLIETVAELRSAFEAHNRFEEGVLRPILRGAGVFDDIRLDNAISEHVDEHRAMRGRLVDGPAAELRATVATLRGHLEAEERHFDRLARPLPLS